MQEAFDIFGMQERYRTWTDEIGKRAGDIVGPEGLVPVIGWKNRHTLRSVAGNVKNVLASFEAVAVQGGTAVRYTGSNAGALDEWRAITGLLGKTTVVAIVTPGLEYYVRGTQLGYDQVTRHLFKRSNSLEQIGTPVDPVWKADLSGYTVTIVGDWEEIKRSKTKGRVEHFSDVAIKD